MPWIVLFFVLCGLWLLVLVSTFSLANTNILVDDQYDLSVISGIFVGISMTYYGSSIFIFSAFLVVFKKVEKHQAQAIQRYARSFPGNRGPLRSMQLVSIIIPARNEEGVIKRTISSCLAQTYQNIEVLVICHNSSDNTFKESKGIQDPRVAAIELTTKEAGKGIALNHGVEKSKGQYILVVDADGILATNFIETTIPLFQNGAKPGKRQMVAAVQGRFVSSNRNYNTLTRMLSLEDELWSVPYMSIRSFFGKRCPIGGTGFMVDKDILNLVEGFTNSLVDDYELTFRLLKNYQILYAPLSRVYDEKPPKLDIMLRQRARWLKGFFDLLNRRIAQPGDLLGNLYWLSPIGVLCGMGILLIPSYAAIHNMLFDYLPYRYAYLPLDLWFILTGISVVLQVGVLMKAGSPFSRVVSLPLYMLFSQYLITVALKSFFVKSWGNTKTIHGFVTDTDLECVYNRR